MNPFKILALILASLLTLAGCGNIPERPAPFSKNVSSSEEAALTAYSSLLSGDKMLLDDAQTEMWWIPDFQEKDIAYEYTYLDLDGDGTVELIIQMVDNPCGYNAVFHYQDDKLFCWSSDGVEMSCRDYPLNDGTMVRQYDYNGTRSYTIFHYQTDGETEYISFLFARKESIYEDSSTPCPYYEIDENEVSQTVFDEQLDALVTSRMLNRSAWTTL